MFNKTLPLTGKVNLLIIAVMILGIGAVTLILAGNFVNTQVMVNNAALKRESGIVYSAIENIMLPGQAELANSLFDRLSSGRGLRIGIYRTDGTQAFIDNSTIRGVNSYIGKEIFPERINPALPMTASELNFLKQVIEHPEQEEPIFASTTGNQDFIRMLSPLINTPKCSNCHGVSHTVRGVIDVSFNVTESNNLQRNAISQAIFFFILTVVVSAILLSWFMHRAVLFPLVSISKVCDSVKNGDFTPRIQLTKKDEIGELASTVNRMIDGLVERFKLAKYVSSSTIASLQESEESKRVDRVVMFTDIRGFTSFTERQKATTVVESLNAILGLQTEIIQNNHGDVDKYVGDEVMAVFSGSHAHIDAVNAALDIQEKMKNEGGTFNFLEVGIGINAGELIEGKIGTDTRADFTVIGDPVNLAARLCSLAGPGEIMVSQTILELIKKDRSSLNPCSLHGPYSLSIKGKKDKQPIYKIRKKL